MYCSQSRSRIVCAIVTFAAFLCYFLPEAAQAQIQIERNGRSYTLTPQAYADVIQEEVAAIRGLPFKKEITAQNQSQDDFDLYLDQQLKKQIPGDRAKYYGKIVRTLGLHRGPQIGDMLDMTKSVMKSQAAAYYDPDNSAFYVLMSDMPEFMLGGIYAHELYHGLQDQYYDLDAYLMEPMREGMNDDEVMARQCVVEGEATLLMTLWSLERMFGQKPAPEMVAWSVRTQATMNAEMMRNLTLDESVQGMIGQSEGLGRAVAALDEIPAFMIETLVGAYMKGMLFVFEVQQKGWDEVERLFDAPPVSTEQILHPEKWFAREMPTRIEWADFDEAEALEGWELIDSNTLGEIQLGIVLAEHELDAEAQSAAAGWDGDRYAVLRRPETDEWALMLSTTWDSEAEAAEFADAYSRLLMVKYPDLGVNAVVSLEGRSVLIAEAPGDTDLEGWLDFMRGAEKVKLDPPDLTRPGRKAA